MANSPLTPTDFYSLRELPPALLGLYEVVLVDLLLPVHDLKVLLPFQQVFLDFADIRLD